MTKWTASELPNLSGRIVLVTGAGSGIGLITARELARVGATVVLGVRDVDKGRAAVAGLPGEFDVRHLDVSDLTSVRRFAEAWAGPLHVLINNAGVMDIPSRRTADGLDLQTSTNYTGPFVLTNLLLPHVIDRVVSVTSQLHRRSKLDTADVDWRTRDYDSMMAYQDSKLALVLFSLELQRRLDAAGSPVRSMVAHPGIATTTLAAHSKSGRINSFSAFLNDPEHGALPTLFAATRDIPGNSYVGPDGFGSIKGHPKVRAPGKKGRDVARGKELWAATAALTGIGA